MQTICGGRRLTRLTANSTRKNRPVRRDILEYSASGSTHQVDRGRGLIHNVKILGSQSRNGGCYTAAAMSHARPLYEGARVNINHPSRSTPDAERAFHDWFGVLENVRLMADGLYGDLAYLTSHALASQVCEAAERFPGSFGLSHNAQVSEAEREGQVVYEAIHRVRSVDIVCKPATTRGIFESETLAMQAEKTGDVLCDEVPDDVPSLDGTPTDAAGVSSDDDAAWDAFVTQLREIHDADLAPAAQRAQAMELIGAMFGGDEASAEQAAAAAADAVDQGATDATWLPADGSLESIAKSREVSARRRARDVLEAMGLAADASRVQSLAAIESAADRRTLLTGWLMAGGGGAPAARPRSSRPGFGKPGGRQTRSGRGLGRPENRHAATLGPLTLCGGTRAIWCRSLEPRPGVV